MPCAATMLTASPAKPLVRCAITWRIRSSYAPASWPASSSMSWAVRMTERWRAERQHRDPRAVAARALELEHAAVVGPAGQAQHGDAERGEQRAHGFEAVRVVVVAGDHHDRARRCRAGRASVWRRALRPRGRRSGLVQVAGDEHEVGAFGVGDTDDLGEHRAVLVEARLPLHGLADVPVGGVQELHADSPAGREAVERVVGQRGCDRGIEARRRAAAFRRPGRPRRERELDHERHRDLAAATRTSCPAWRSWPAGGARRTGSRTRARAASAGSSRPATRIDEFEMTRRSTSLAVCCAPMRMMPSERPRSATSSRISLIGESPCAGAYLLSSSSTRNSSGRADPDASFSSNARRKVTPTTKRLARSWRLWRSTTVTLASEVRTWWSGGASTSARMRWPSARCEDTQPADERVDRARCR